MDMPRKHRPSRREKNADICPYSGFTILKKLDQIRGMFDSAQFDGVFFNKVLLSRPDLTNNLLGVLFL